ncbi:MAG: hypothetical protein K6U04_05575 [Armatimonadetes bacterium]|nr:hypothetical protein [Armatimonadota bacterium]
MQPVRNISRIGAAIALSLQHHQGQQRLRIKRGRRAGAVRRAGNYFEECPCVRF